MIKRILIVDDDPDILFIMATYLAELGPNFQVETCDSGAQALAAARRRAFDLVIADYELPGFDGLELVRALAEQQPGLKVILMSGYGMATTTTESARFQVSSFLAKPFTMAKVLGTVRTALESDVQ